MFPIMWFGGLYTCCMAPLSFLGVYPPDLREGAVAMIPVPRWQYELYVKVWGESYASMFFFPAPLGL